MLPKSQKYGQNNKNTSEILAIFPKCLYIRAYPYKYGRLRHTGNKTPVWPINSNTEKCLSQAELEYFTNLSSAQPCAAWLEN